MCSLSYWSWLVSVSVFQHHSISVSLKSGRNGKAISSSITLPLDCQKNQPSDKWAAYCIVWAITHISTEDRADYSKVVEKYEENFKVQKNLVFECATFNQAHQLSDETAYQFITRLHLLADNCEFGNLQHEIICDRFVIGIHDRR